MAVFWVFAPCSLVEVYRRFRGAFCLHHQADGQTVFLAEECHGHIKIFIMDETGTTIVQTKSSKILAKREEKQGGIITSVECGGLSAAVICMSEDDYFLSIKNEGRTNRWCATRNTVFV
jgi:hypothetical protein